LDAASWAILPETHAGELTASEDDLILVLVTLNDKLASVLSFSEDFRTNSAQRRDLDMDCVWVNQQLEVVPPGEWGGASSSSLSLSAKDKSAALLAVVPTEVAPNPFGSLEATEAQDEQTASQQQDPVVDAWDGDEGAQTE